MYIIVEMEHRNTEWKSTLKLIMATNQKFLYDNEVQTTIAVSLLEKNCHIWQQFSRERDGKPFQIQLVVQVSNSWLSAYT